MILRMFLSAAAVAAALGAAGVAVAQGGPPAELPPEDYEGRSFVDSRGCVYVRGGIDGTVTWVPRVSAERAPVCGQAPTFDAAGGDGAAPQETTIAASESAPGAEPAPTAPVSRPERIAAPEPMTAPDRRADPAPSVAPGPVRRPASKPVATAPVPVRAAPAMSAWRPKPVPAPRPLVLDANRFACSGYGGTWRVRCDSTGRPSHVTLPDPSRETLYRDRAADLGLTPGTRILPDHLAATRGAAPPVPRGYKPAWTDGRLNPRRAEQSVRGFYATQDVWSNSVPRRGTPGATEDPVIVPR